MRLVTGLLVLLALCSCAAPTPTAAPGRAAVLDPELIFVDRIDFRSDRVAPVNIEAACELLDSLTTGSTCRFETASGRQGELEVPDTAFRDYWYGEVSRYYRGYRHSERLVLAETYFAVEVVDASTVAAPCVLAVDTGSRAPLTITAYPSVEETQGLADDEYPPLATSLELCAQARESATTVLAELDPGGGSITG